jgi:hypothetical protein
MHGKRLGLSRGERRGVEMTLDIKQLYYEADTRKHQMIVARLLINAAQRLLKRATVHDETKLHEPEISAYIEPVYALNTEEVPYGSERYIELCKQMGKGWDHHKSFNDHHIEFFLPYAVETLNDPILQLDMFALIEMCCDWIAAAQRRGNEPVLALKTLTDKYPMDEQLQQLIRNTLARLNPGAVDKI